MAPGATYNVCAQSSTLGSLGRLGKEPASDAKGWYTGLQLMSQGEIRVFRELENFEFIENFEFQKTSGVQENLLQKARSLPDLP